MRPVILTLACSLTAAPAINAGLPHFGDAAIHAVDFVDRNEGWAVGDDGVIWHTIDGGDKWERQSSGVRASLRDVQFLTPYTGYAVGRTALPGGGSSGVVLATSDGGLKWTRLGFNSLPGLASVRFFSAEHGIAVGDGCTAYPSGIFLTTDGGQRWKPIPGPRTPGWNAAAFTEPDNGVLAGNWGRLTPFADGTLGDGTVPIPGGRAVTDVHLNGSHGVAVGQGGLVLLSTTAGEHWTGADLGLPREVLMCCDFNAVSAVGSHVWVVGRPGTVILHSADHGKTWEPQRTGQNLPLHAVEFLSESEGWAVGELGTVVATKDGGKTWKVQRRGGQRAAVLVVSADAVPEGAMASMGEGDGYLITALRVSSADPELASPDSASEPDRISETVRLAGGAAAESLWQFAVPAYAADGREWIISEWDRRHGGDAPEHLLCQLVFAMRLWQPEVVVAVGSKGPMSAIVREAVTEAFKRAGEKAAFAEHSNTLGLPPWGAKKLYALDDGKHQLLSYRLEGAESHQRMMEGIRLAAGGTARRPEAEFGGGPPSDARREWEKLRRSLDAASASPNADTEEVFAQLSEALTALPSIEAAAEAASLASEFADAGRWGFARDLFTLMTDRYPADPHTAQAYRWLALYQASGEVNRRHELGKTAADAANPIQPAGFETPDENADAATNARLTAAIETGVKLTAFGQLFHADPSIRLPLDSARRRLGAEQDARWYKAHVARSPAGGDAWRDCVAAELWQGMASKDPKPMAACYPTDARPKLDGVLDDGCWAGERGFERLKDAARHTAEGQPTEVLFAADKEYLYVALRCQGGNPVQPAANRSHDMNVEQYDHVTLTLDLDRDYQTAYRLRIDRRGGVADDCWGDQSWNPKWYVAVKDGGDGWTAEVAIPLAELASAPPADGEVWAMNVTRSIPGKGLQAWSPSAGTRPEGMGLLRFGGK